MLLLTSPWHNLISIISCHASLKAFSRLSPCCFSLSEAFPTSTNTDMPFFPFISRLNFFFLSLDANNAISNSYATSMLVAICLADLITFFLIPFLLFFSPLAALVHNKLLRTRTCLFCRFCPLPSTAGSLCIAWSPCATQIQVNILLQ